MDFMNLHFTLIQKDGKIIHRIWFGTIPSKKQAKKDYEKMSLYRESWSKHNPDWYIMEWDKKTCKELVKTFFPEHIDMIEKYKYEIQRCDVMRYLILYKYGGIYADMDYYCNRPFDEVLKKYTNNIYFVETPNKVLSDEVHISNSLMYSRPGHPFWKKLMIELEIHKDCPSYYTKHLCVMFTTGPGILNRVYLKNKYRFGLKSYPYKLFHPYGLTDSKLSLLENKEVYAVHVGKGSWESRDSKFFIAVFRDWKIMIFILGCFILCLLILKFYRI